MEVFPGLTPFQLPFSSSKPTCSKVLRSLAVLIPSTALICVLIEDLSGKQLGNSQVRISICLGERRWSEESPALQPPPSLDWGPSLCPGSFYHLSLGTGLLPALCPVSPLPQVLSVPSPHPPPGELWATPVKVCSKNLLGEEGPFFKTVPRVAAVSEMGTQIHPWVCFCSEG